ncbi:MAG: hypothetical protein AAF253_11255, partial [Pseudomonadota bacterium]
RPVTDHGNEHCYHRSIVQKTTHAPFMESEDNTAVALRCFDLQSAVLEKENEKKACDQVRVLGESQVPETCLTVEARVQEAKDALLEDAACAARAT